ncbi:MAG TPA: hypothetical protein VGS19_21215 [Streptosporangiaceae bacterium]|nr:hypothetical protein [Streptosporangiaceae bacterium]
MSHLAEIPAQVTPRLAGQLPLALIVGAGVAAVLWWLDWLHTDEWDVAPARPGLVCLARRVWHTWSISSGGVVTRDGVSLGVEAATGRCVALSWQQARAGVLVTGADPAAVAACGLQVVHAAVRRRQPVVVVDLAGSPTLATAVAAVCAACDAPLQVCGPATRISLAEVVRCRAVALFSLDAAGHDWVTVAVAAQVTADLAASYTGQQAALAPAGLVLVNGCEAAGPAVLAALSAAGQQGSLGWVLTTTAPAAAGTLAARAGTCVVYRVADPALADQLAGLTGSRLVPIGAGRGGVGQPGGQAGYAGGFGMAAEPAVPAGSLCSLGEGDFVVTARGSAVRASAVAARIPARQAVPHAAPQAVVRSGWAG